MSGSMIPVERPEKPEKLTAREIGVLQPQTLLNTRDDTEYNESEDEDAKISILGRRPHVLIRTKEKEIVIGKDKYSVDVYALCGMIRRITQQIGQYNENKQDAYAAFMAAGLRKIRTDMVSSLESSFGVHFYIDEGGNSTFYLG